MSKVSLLAALALLSFSSAAARTESRFPAIRQLELVTQLPAELPQRVKGFAYDGKKFWATIYLGAGRFATLEPDTLAWTVSTDVYQHKAIAAVSGSFLSPGAICFADGTLWVAGAYGDSFGSIDLSDWSVERLFRGKRREDHASQSYSSIAFDGTYLWIAWHWFKYVLPTSETQLLLKVEPASGEIVAQHALSGGTRNDSTHGLTWDGTRLWHVKDSRLSAIDPYSGLVTAQYRLAALQRPSGLAWDGQALWIAEFDGRIWRLPFGALAGEGARTHPRTQRSP